jgi:hypothetical protein
MGKIRGVVSAFSLYFQLVGLAAEIRTVHETEVYGGVICSLNGACSGTAVRYFRTMRGSSSRHPASPSRRGHRQSPRGSSRSPSQKPGTGRSGETPSGDHEFDDPPGLAERVPHRFGLPQGVPSSHSLPRRATGARTSARDVHRHDVSFPASAGGHGAPLPGRPMPGRAGMA